jgi:hypothetical protein
MFWSNVLASNPWICIVGALVTISLYVLHSSMDDVKLGVSIGSPMNLRSLDCQNPMQELNVLMVVLMCVFLMNSFVNSRLWLKVVLFRCRSLESSIHLPVVYSYVLHSYIKYCFLIAWAPCLGFCVENLELIMTFMCIPLIWLLLLVGCGCVGSGIVMGGSLEACFVRMKSWLVGELL